MSPAGQPGLALLSAVPPQLGCTCLGTDPAEKEPSRIKGDSFPLGFRWFVLTLVYFISSVYPGLSVTSAGVCDTACLTAEPKPLVCDLETIFPCD